MLLPMTTCSPGFRLRTSMAHLREAGEGSNPSSGRLPFFRQSRCQYRPPLRACGNGLVLGAFCGGGVVEKRRRRENLEPQRFLGCAVPSTGWSKWHKGQVSYLSLSRHVSSPSICFFRPVGGAVATSNVPTACLAGLEQPHGEQFRGAWWPPGRPAARPS